MVQPLQVPIAAGLDQSGADDRHLTSAVIHL
jgi:hypothetical protein